MQRYIKLENFLLNWKLQMQSLHWVVFQDGFFYWYLFQKEEEEEEEEGITF